MPTLAFDTETALITERCKAPPLSCVSFAYRLGSGSGSQVFSGLLHWTEAEEHVVEWLSREDLRIVGHNVAYDFGVICAQFPHLTSLVWAAYAAGRIADTMIRQMLIDIGRGIRHPKNAQPYSLDAMTKKHLGYALDKNSWRLRYGELRDVPLVSWPDGAIEYPRKDAESTLLIDEKQEETFGSGITNAVDQAKAAWWLHLMAAWGLRTDLPRVEKLEQETLDEYVALEKTLVESGLMRDDGSRNTKAAKARMESAMKALEKQMKLTKTGDISLDKEACADSGDPVLEAYAELSALQTILSKDVPVLKTGQVHSRFTPIVATGRVASSKPNVQNQRRKGGARECFIPRDGHVFVDNDYKVIELRTFAQVCIWAVGSSRLAERINGGFDPHLDLGAQLSNISYEEALTRYKAGDEQIAEARQRSKPANFGYPGGMGARTFAKWTKAQYGIVLTEEEAQELRDRWFENWPEASQYFDWIKRKHKWRFSPSRLGEVTQIEQFVSKRTRGGCFFTEACNGYFQGLAADIGKAAGFAISRACYDKSAGSILYGSRIVNFIHDEFIVEVLERTAHECAMEVARLMVEAAKPFIPDVPAEVDPLLCRRWSKKAKTLWGADGRLIPWDDAA